MRLRVVLHTVFIIIPTPLGLTAATVKERMPR